jgi:phosphoribosylformylglycinamidine cyclo-ligase
VSGGGLRPRRGRDGRAPGSDGPIAFDSPAAASGSSSGSGCSTDLRREAGDAIVGLASSGLHANGFSLLRSLLAEFDLDLGGPYQAQLRRTLGDVEAERAIEREPEHALATLGEVLLTPTRIYAPAILRLRDILDAAGAPLRGVAHVTGGGLPGNVPRAIPVGHGARLDPSRWPLPSVMRLLGALGGLDDADLRATFNGGIGMIAIVAADGVEIAHRELAAAGLRSWLVGEVVTTAELGGRRYEEAPLLGTAG